MEIRCENCSHVGPAASVEPGAQGVALICENCGHANLLATGASQPGASDPPDDAQHDGSVDGSAISPEVLAEFRRHSEADADMGAWLKKDALSALIPTPGEGRRCLKCGHLLDARDRAAAAAAEFEPASENCPRCGLNQAEAQNYAPGEAPWEQPPAGKEAEFEQAELLWQASEASDGARRDPARLAQFAAFIREEDLLDLGIRRLRLYLIAHPEDAEAVGHLKDLAERMQSRVIVATAQVHADAKHFEQDIGRFKNRLMLVAFILAAACVVMFLVLYFK